MDTSSSFFVLSYVTVEEASLRLAAAAGLSFLLGLDREARQKSFGLRTHMLLCVGTAAFVLILMEMIHQIGEQTQLVEVDPARVIQAIIIGIGFLAAGTIIRSEKHIIGATTGAGIWVIGAIGLACGLGMYFYAVLTTIIILFIVVGLYPLDRWLEKKSER